uniref:Uncharacterized protein n=1 Tax=Proboscia inermis TaxID=420281 RepID=A0A7S0GLK1_9STRA
MEEQHDVASEVIAQWEARCTSLTEQMDEIQETADIAVEELEERFSDLESELEEGKKNEEESKLKKLHLVDQLSLNLKNAKDELHVALSRGENLSTKLVEEEERYSFMENAKLSLEHNLALELQSRVETQMALESEEKLVKAAKGDMETLQIKLQEEQTRVSNITTELCDCQVVVGQLQDEVRDSHECLQSRITDEISVKTTEKVTEALRSQISDVREQLVLHKDELSKEHESRLETERELINLKADLAFLVESVEDDSESEIHKQMRKLVGKATGDKIKREKNEIDELRSSLEHVMEELLAAKTAEREADERAASARLGASLNEQEALAVKADLAYLSETIVRMREEDDSALESLRFRIGFLEEENENSLLTHEDELRPLRLALDQIVLEKDRLLHSLHEAESINATLQERERENFDAEPEMELHLLRIEKSQLLASLSEAASTAERRIREAVTTVVAQSEAETILEKELRYTAEQVCDEMQLQMNELQQSNRDISLRLESSTSNDRMDILNVSSSSNVVAADTNEILMLQISTLNAEKQKFKDDNLSLQNKLIESKSSNEKLTERCRHAEVLSRKATRGGNFESDVAEEVARLRCDALNASQANGHSNYSFRISSNMNGGMNTSDLMGMSAEELYDMVSQLRESVKEERDLYHELLAEHEDLLALLAQQDLERSSLQASLSNHAGESAVADAIREAEESAVARFGEYVRLA